MIDYGVIFAVFIGGVGIGIGISVVVMLLAIRRDMRAGRVKPLIIAKCRHHSSGSCDVGSPVEFAKRMSELHGEGTL